jgi:hypothetical protein
MMVGGETDFVTAVTMMARYLEGTRKHGTVAGEMVQCLVQIVYIHIILALPGLIFEKYIKNNIQLPKFWLR